MGAESDVLSTAKRDALVVRRALRVTLTALTGHQATITFVTLDTAAPVVAPGETGGFRTTAWTGSAEW